MTNTTKKCMTLVNDIEDALSWVDNYVSDEDGKASVLRELKEKKRLSNRLLVSSRSNPAIAIFGKSQAGKSFLVSDICSGSATGSMKVVLGSEEVDFLEDLNPKNDGESTGAVTRFTLQGQVRSEGKEVVLELLTEIELVKILANGYFSDVQNEGKKSFSAASISEQLSGLNIATTKSTLGISDDDIYDLKEYLENHFFNEYLVRDLTETGLWDDLAELIPRLTSDQRLEIFKCFWGDIDSLTDIFRVLTKVIRDLNYSTEVYCGKAAMLPKRKEVSSGEFVSNTILDVNLVDHMLEGDTLEPVLVFPAAGVVNPVSVPRCALTGVIREINLTVPEVVKNTSKGAFFGQADLLDFPGARSREEIHISKLVNNNERSVQNVFLRGKVAYLFDRYAYYPNDITSLVFCQVRNNQEVKSLSSLIGRWVNRTHGISPSDRQAIDTNLFFAFTMFDFELEEAKTGSDDDFHIAWTSRLKTNLEVEMSKSVEQSWPTEWDLSGGFKNCFWIRNPVYSSKIFDDKNGNYKEGYELAIENQKETFLSNPYVKAHFQSPVEAWEAAATPNNTGVQYLVDGFTRTCTKEARERQIDKLLSEYLSDVKDTLTPYHKSGDLSELLKMAQQESMLVVGALVKSMQHKNEFGQLLDELMVVDKLAWQTYFNYLQGAANDSDTFSADDDNAEMGVDLEDSLLLELGLEIPETKVKKEDKAEVFAQRLILKWENHLRSKYHSNDVKRTIFGLKVAEFKTLVKGLISSAARVRLKQKVADDIREFVDDDAQEGIDVIARLSTKVLNDFILSAGWAYIDKSNRPLISGKPLMSKELFSAPVTPLVTKDFAGKSIFNPWILGVKHVYEANVRYEYDIGSLDLAANKKLGGLIEKFS